MKNSLKNWQLKTQQCLSENNCHDWRKKREKEKKKQTKQIKKVVVVPFVTCYVLRKYQLPFWITR